MTVTLNGVDISQLVRDEIPLFKKINIDAVDLASDMTLSIAHDKQVADMLYYPDTDRLVITDGSEIFTADVDSYKIEQESITLTLIESTIHELKTRTLSANYNAGQNPVSILRAIINNDAILDLPSFERASNWAESIAARITFFTVSSETITALQGCAEIAKSFLLNVFVINGKLSISPLLGPIPPAWPLNLDRVFDLTEQPDRDNLYNGYKIGYYAQNNAQLVDANNTDTEAKNIGAVSVTKYGAKSWSDTDTTAEGLICRMAQPQCWALGNALIKKYAYPLNRIEMKSFEKYLSFGLYFSYSGRIYMIYDCKYSSGIYEYVCYEQ